MPTPVVFLAFSNDVDNPLSSLGQESRHIYQVLSTLEDRRIIRVFREENADTDKIIATLNRLADPANDYQLVLFHYGGHADGDHIQLVDGKGDATGLAQLLAEFKKHLGLVFLNGCSTEAQVEKLLQLGIPAVIATSAPIGDQTASQFAKLFYERLAARGTVDQAFDAAVNGMQFKQGKGAGRFPVEDISRGFLREKAPAPVFPWGIYFDKNSKAGDWHFPTAAPAAVSRPADAALNEYLLDVPYAMVGHHDDLSREKLDALSDGELYEILIKEFPWPVSAQIRVLLSNDASMNAPGLPRLEQILNTFLAVGQLAYFILMSRLWDLRARKEIPSIGLALGETFGLRPDNVRTFDYLSHARQVMEEILSHPGASLFVEEMTALKDSLAEGDELAEAYLFLEAKKEQLVEGRGDLLQTEIGEVCLEAEYALSVILSRFAFLIRYPMVTIREIQLQKPRHHEPEYQHFLGKLHAYMESSIVVSSTPRTYPRYLDNRSVILLRDLDDPQPFLNLTPFLIDRNAFGETRDNAGSLFSFAYAAVPPDGEQEEYYYIMSSNNLLQWLEKPEDNIHKFHTGWAPQAAEGRLARRRSQRRREEEEAPPYAGLRELFEQLKSDW